MKYTLVACSAIAVCLSTIVSMPAVAADGGGYAVSSVIDGTVGHDVQGVVGVNMAAGDSNLQSNATAVALGQERGRGVARTNVVQSVDVGNVTVPDLSVAKIGGEAFSGASGAIGINQASGAANAQANNVAIAFGVGAEVTAETDLAQTVTGEPLKAPVSGGEQQRHASVADTAFSGTRGIVQLNQSAGVGNATGNNFALRFQMDAPK